MLSNYSWKEYAAVMGILLFIYYLVIGYLYYWKDIKILIGSRSGSLNRTVSATSEQVSTDITEVSNLYNEQAIEELERIVLDIKKNILVRAGISAGKEALLSHLKERLANYDGLRQPAYRDAINKFLIENSRELCGVTFHGQELNAAWESISH